MRLTEDNGVTVYVPRHSKSYSSMHNALWNVVPDCDASLTKMETDNAMKFRIAANGEKFIVTDLGDNTVQLKYNFRGATFSERLGHEHSEYALRSFKNWVAEQPQMEVAPA